MSQLDSFSTAAKSLSRNPLGIIALFIVLIYAFAALTLGVSQSLPEQAQILLVYFLIAFPFCVLVMFGWLVSKHHEKLYAPADYKTDESFLVGVQVRTRRTAEVQAQQEALKENLRQKIMAADSAQGNNAALADQLTEEVVRNTEIVIDARYFLDDPSAMYNYPVAAFESLNDLNDEIYFKISGRVQPFEYGYSLVLENKKTGSIIRNARMIIGAPPGKPIADDRSLSEIGIVAGTTFEVVRPVKVG